MTFQDQSNTQQPAAQPDTSQVQQSQPAPVSNPDQELEDSIINTLRFDPFKDTNQGAGVASPAAAPPRTEPQGSVGAAGTAPAPAATPAADPNAQNGQPSGEAALIAAAQNLSAAADKLQAPAPAQQQQQVQPKDDLPPYLYDIPPQLVDALASENPQQRTAALQTIVAGTARAVHGEMLKVINDLRTALPSQFQQMMQAHNFRETVRRDFYGQYPMLQNEALAPIVGQATQQVLAEAAAQGRGVNWGPQMAQAIAERVFGAIPALRAGMQQQQQQQRPVAPPAPQPQPQHMFTPGSRPAAGSTVEADILNTLF